MKVVKVKISDGSQDIWKLLEKDVRELGQRVKRGMGYIVRDDIMRQFHDATDNKWKIYIIDQRKLEDYVEKGIANVCPVKEEYEEEDE